ncbi:MAG: hypothetical protein HZA01_07650 [Nitrospinae bacterium]|nr:hypothetical protein [Nitrospinota bacterium]
MKRFLLWSIILAFSCASVLGGIMFAYSRTRAGGEDLGRAREYAKLFLFRRGFVESLDQDEIFRLYQQKCYRRCHGEAAMITVVLPPAGWMQIVERMRVQQGVDISGREADAIIRYLELKYPSQRSNVPYSVRMEINRSLWRNDVGYGDLYVDVIFGTPVYFDAMNAGGMAEEYGAKESLVFIVSLTVHEGRVKSYPMEKLAFLRINGKEYPPLDGWRLRFDTADGHHLEGVLRFPKKDLSGKNIAGPGTKSMELVLKNLETDKERVYQWDLPIRYPREYENAPEQ